MIDVPPSALGSTLVGRDDELAVARGRLAAAQTGAGGVLLITGEAGIGKSHLLQDLTAAARADGVTVLSGQAIPGGRTYRAVSAAVAGYLRAAPAVLEAPEISPFRAVLGRIAPGWVADGTDEPGSGVDPIVSLGEALLRLFTLAGQGEGCLVVLEDLHWADADTLALIGYLAGALPGLPVLVAISARDDQSPAVGGAPGRLTLPDIASMAGVTAVRLGRLPPAAVSAIALAAAGGRPVGDAMLAELIATADGLPVVIDELLAALLETGGGSTGIAVPPTLAGLVRRRFGDLEETDRQVVQAAAVLGVEPSWVLLPAISGQPEARVLAALESATAAGLLISDGPQLRWRHPLTRDAVLTTMLAPEQAVIARSAAAVVQAAGGPATEALQAELLAMAGEPVRAGELLLLLAHRDITRGALRSAGELIIRAGLIGADQGRVAVEKVALLTAVGREIEALEVGAAALPGVTGDQHAELCLRLARTAVSGGRWPAAVEFVERAGRPADPRSGILLAEAAFGAGDPERAAILASSAADLAQAAGLPEATCAALLVIGRCGELTDPAVASTAFRRAAQYAAEHGLLPWRVQALFGLGRIELLLSGDPAPLAQAGELAVEAGLVALALSIKMIQAELAMVVDGPRAAAATARQVIEHSAQLGLTGLQGMSLLLTAAASVVDGDLDSMRSQLATAVALPHVSMEVAAGAAAIRSLPALLAHDLRLADDLLDSGFRSLTEHASAAPFAYWGMWALLRTAVADESGPRQFLRVAPPGIRDINRGAVGYADAIAAGREGRPVDAAELFAQADQMLARTHWWRRLLRTVVLDAAVRDGWGDPIPELRNDLAVFERDDEHGLARICRDLLRLAGAPTRRGRGSGPVPADLRAKGVTSREVDVLELIATGLSNAEIGQRLFLSTRTVETHVSNLLAKLGCVDRTGLRRLAANRTNSVVGTDP